MKKLLLTFLFCMVGFSGVAKGDILHLTCKLDSFQNLIDLKYFFAINLKDKTVVQGNNEHSRTRNARAEISDSWLVIRYFETDVYPTHAEINRYTGEMIAHYGSKKSSFQCEEKSKKF